MAATYPIIKKTQDVLGKYVTKPPLTEKLLNKPPFRFLHDVVISVIKNHRVLHGLYEEHEMHSDQVKDKEAKMRFLEKLIDTLSFALGGPPLGAKPSKIVSGQEPAKTNEMLQALGKLVARKIDTTQAVQKVLNGDKPGMKSTSGSKGSASKSRSSSKENNARNSNKDEGGGSGSRRSSIASVSGQEKARSRGRRSSDKKSLSRSPSKDPNRHGAMSHGTIHEDQGQNGEPESQPEEVTKASHPEENGHQDAAEVVNGHGGDDHSEQQNGHTSMEMNGHKEQEEQPEEPNSRPVTTRRSHESRRSESGSSRPHTGYGKSRTADHRQKKEDNEPLPDDMAVLGEGGPATGADDQEKKEPKNETQPTPPHQKRPGSAIKSARPRTSMSIYISHIIGLKNIDISNGNFFFGFPGQGRSRTARPPSARPAAPRLKEKKEVVPEEQVQTRPQTGKVANVILANDDDQDDDAEAYLVEEAPKDNLSLTLQQGPAVNDSDVSC